MSCRHLDRDTFTNPDEPALCSAYPSGIPNEIVYGGADHTEFRGDEEVPGVKHDMQVGYEEFFDLWKDGRDEGDTEEKRHALPLFGDDG